MFLVIDVILYWSLISLIERKVIRYIFGMFRRNRNAPTSRVSLGRTEMIGDQDIAEEEQKVLAASPEDLPIRVC